MLASTNAGLEEQVLRRVAGQHELGEDGEVGAVSLGPLERREHAPGVALEVADDRVELAERNPQAAHGAHRTGRDRTGRDRPDGLRLVAPPRSCDTCASLAGHGGTGRAGEERAMQSQREYVLRTVEERGVRFVQLWFTDVLGIPKTFSITPAELENALDEGMTFDGSAIDGFSRVQESDVIACPDPKTFQILPFRTGNDSTVARVFCDISNLDGTPFEGDPRHVLRRQLERAHDLGFSFFAAPELEYFYFADDGPKPRPLDHGSYFELTVADLATDLRKRTVLTLEEMGIPVEYAQHEDAPSQHEIDLRYTDALTMADTIMTVRLVVKEVAQERGVHATFMPKPLSGVQGSGMHTHFSLFANGTNAFYGPDDERGLSTVAKQFIAGLLEHASEITAVTNQWVNSYKRLVAGYEAPVTVSWAYNNRSALGAAPHREARQDRVHARRVPRPRSGLQSVPRLRRHPGGGAAGHRGRLPAPAGSRHEPVPDVPGGAQGRRDPAASPHARRGPRGDGALRARRDDARRPRVRMVHPQQAHGVGGVHAPGDPVRARALPPGTLIGPAGFPMEPLLCFPDPASGPLAAALDAAGYPWCAVGNASDAQRLEPEDGWAGAVVSAVESPEAGFGLCRALRKRESPVAPLLLVVDPELLEDLQLREDLFDDFVLATATPAEIEARLTHLLWRTGRGKHHEVIAYGPLALNLETYQAVCAGRPLDLTFMEYELLRFLAAHPGKVFTREVLLSRVWGYEYFGGARTVDVHIRRLRAKLGEEHAHLIETVRSVGYRFGRARWVP